MRRDGAPFCLSRAEAKNPRADPRSLSRLHRTPATVHHAMIAIDEFFSRLPGTVRVGQAPASSGQLRTDRWKFAEITLIVGRPSARFEDHRPAVFLPDHRGARACAPPHRATVLRRTAALSSRRATFKREKNACSRIFVIPPKETLKKTLVLGNNL